MSVSRGFFDEQNISAISRLFSPTLIRELAKKGFSPMFTRLAKESSIINFDSQSPVSDFFESAFFILKKKFNRHEYVYKSAITQKILLGKHSLNTSVLLNEFRVCNNKADSIILNGTSTVYEIKSERDTLARLESQMFSYLKVFANVNVITGENHLISVLESVPQEVGVLLLKDQYNISIIRESISSTDTISPEVIFNSIQLKEAMKILKYYGMEIPKLPNTRMYEALRERFVTLSPKEAHDGMVKVLKVTRSHIPLADFVNALPKSLQAVALSTSLRKQDHKKLVEAVNTPMCEAMKWN